MSEAPEPGPRPGDEGYEGVRAGHINILSDKILDLYGVLPVAVREEAAQAAVEVVERFLVDEGGTFEVQPTDDVELGP